MVFSAPPRIILARGTAVPLPPLRPPPQSLLSSSSTSSSTTHNHAAVLAPSTSHSLPPPQSGTITGGSVPSSSSGLAPDHFMMNQQGGGAAAGTGVGEVSAVGPGGTLSGGVGLPPAAGSGDGISTRPPILGGGSSSGLQATHPSQPVPRRRNVLDIRDPRTGELVIGGSMLGGVRSGAGEDLGTKRTENDEDVLDASRTGVCQGVGLVPEVAKKQADGLRKGSSASTKKDKREGSGEGGGGGGTLSAFDEGSSNDKHDHRGTERSHKNGGNVHAGRKTVNTNAQSPAATSSSQPGSVTRTEAAGVSNPRLPSAGCCSVPPCVEGALANEDSSAVHPGGGQEMTRRRPPPVAFPAEDTKGGGAEEKGRRRNNHGGRSGSSSSTTMSPQVLPTGTTTNVRRGKAVSNTGEAEGPPGSDVPSQLDVSHGRGGDAVGSGQSYQGARDQERLLRSDSGRRRNSSNTGRDAAAAAPAEGSPYNGKFTESQEERGYRGPPTRQNSHVSTTTPRSTGSPHHSRQSRRGGGGKGGEHVYNSNVSKDEVRGSIRVDERLEDVIRHKGDEESKEPTTNSGTSAIQEGVPASGKPSAQGGTTGHAGGGGGHARKKSGSGDRVKGGGAQGPRRLHNSSSVTPSPAAPPQASGGNGCSRGEEGSGGDHGEKKGANASVGPDSAESVEGWGGGRVGCSSHQRWTSSNEGGRHAGHTRLPTSAGDGEVGGGDASSHQDQHHSTSFSTSLDASRQRGQRRGSQGGDGGPGGGGCYQLPASSSSTSQGARRGTPGVEENGGTGYRSGGGGDGTPSVLGGEGTGGSEGNPASTASAPGGSWVQKKGEGESRLSTTAERPCPSPHASQDTSNTTQSSTGPPAPPRSASTGPQGVWAMNGGRSAADALRAAHTNGSQTNKQQENNPGGGNPGPNRSTAAPEFRSQSYGRKNNNRNSNSHTGGGGHLGKGSSTTSLGEAPTPRNEVLCSSHSSINSTGVLGKGGNVPSTRHMTPESSPAPRPSSVVSPFERENASTLQGGLSVVSSSSASPLLGALPPHANSPGSLVEVSGGGVALPPILMKNKNPNAENNSARGDGAVGRPAVPPPPDDNLSGGGCGMLPLSSTAANQNRLDSSSKASEVSRTGRRKHFQSSTPSQSRGHNASNNQQHPPPQLNLPSGPHHGQHAGHPSSSTPPPGGVSTPIITPPNSSNSSPNPHPGMSNKSRGNRSGRYYDDRHVSSSGQHQGRIVGGGSAGGGGGGGGGESPESDSSAAPSSPSHRHHAHNSGGTPFKSTNAGVSPSSLKKTNMGGGGSERQPMAVPAFPPHDGGGGGGGLFPPSGGFPSSVAPPPPLPTPPDAGNAGGAGVATASSPPQNGCLNHHPMHQRPPPVFQQHSNNVNQFGNVYGFEGEAGGGGAAPPPPQQPPAGGNGGGGGGGGMSPHHQGNHQHNPHPHFHQFVPFGPGGPDGVGGASGGRRAHPPPQSIVMPQQPPPVLGGGGGFPAPAPGGPGMPPGYHPYDMVGGGAGGGGGGCNGMPGLLLGAQGQPHPGQTAGICGPPGGSGGGGQSTSSRALLYAWKRRRKSGCGWG